MTATALLPSSGHYEEAIVHFSSYESRGRNDSKPALEWQAHIMHAHRAAINLTVTLAEAGYYNTTSSEACATEQALVQENSRQLVEHTTTLLENGLRSSAVGDAWVTAVHVGLCDSMSHGLYVGWIAFYVSIAVISGLSFFRSKNDG